MNNLAVAMVISFLFIVWCLRRNRMQKARIQRIRRVQGPDARIHYMNLRGKRYDWRISIESVRRQGQDWVITAWCYEKEEFLIFYASRMYEYFDLIRSKEVKNVPAYFTERYSTKAKAKTWGELNFD